MTSGVAFALASYLLYSCCDAIIKGFGSTLSVFEIAFWSGLFSFLPAIFTKPKGEHWRHMFRTRHPWLLNVRSATGVVGNLCIIFAFVTIPLAEAYSIAFLAPIFVLGMSRFFLKEEVSWHRWMFLAASFAGVLLVVRPGFRELHVGHFSAVLAAVFGAMNTTIIRKIAPVEKRVSLIGLPLGYIVLINGVLMLPEFKLPTPEEFAFLLTIGALGGTGNIFFIAATRRAPVSLIAPAQYSQIAWAVIFGAFFYQEHPDFVAFVGLTVLAAGGIMNVMSDETRIRIFSRLSIFGPASAAGEVSPPIDEPAEPRGEPAPRPLETGAPNR